MTLPVTYYMLFVALTRKINAMPMKIWGRKHDGEI